MTTAEYRTKCEDLCSYTDYASAKALLQTYNEGKWEELKIALEENLKASIAANKHQLFRDLRDLMENVLIMKYSAQEVTQERWETICRLRFKIWEDVEDYDFIKSEIKEEWQKAFESGKSLAQITTRKSIEINTLSAKEVFRSNFHPDHYVAKQ